ncbi:MAG: FHA domain-containing protein [Deltaproteobacteria bacterium]|nr:FHA domain-containing protein [Deltaproteobacteria bacterium]
MVKLVLMQGLSSKKEFLLKEGPNTIGRASECDIPLDSQGISKKHAVVTVEPNKIWIQDLDSRNGVYVNGVKIEKKELKLGDRISFYDVVVQLLPHFIEPQEYLERRTPIVSEPKRMIWYEPFLEFVSRHIEWKYFTLLLFGLFVILNFLLTTPWLMHTAQQKLYLEATKRGEFILKKIADENRKFIQLKNGVLIYDTFHLSTDFGRYDERILSVNIVNPQTKKIVSPAERLDQSVDAVGAVLRGVEAQSLLVEPFNDRRALISYPIFQFDEKNNVQRVAAVVQAVFNTEEIGFLKGEKQSFILKTFIISFLLASVFYFLLHHFTSHIFRQVYQEIKTSFQKGYRPLELKTKFEDMSQIVGSINQVLKKTRDLVSKMTPSEQASQEISSSHNSDEILRSLLTSLPEGVVILSDTYEVVYANPIFYRLANLKDNEEIREKNILDMIENQDLLRNLSHGLGQAASGQSSVEELEIQKEKYQIKISAAQNSDRLIDYYIVQLKRMEWV